MAHLLGAEALHLEFPTKVVFDSVTLGLNDGDRVGVVGKNGDGIVAFHRRGVGGGFRCDLVAPVLTLSQTLTIGFDAQAQDDLNGVSLHQQYGNSECAEPSFRDGLGDSSLPPAGPTGPAVDVVEVAVAETGIELILETRDEAHAHEVIELVRSNGYPVTRMH